MGSKDYFDRVAGQWDSMREMLFPEAVRKAAANAAQVQANRLAADIGAGSGFITEELIQRGLNVIAVDQSPLMIAELKKRFGITGAVDGRVGESEALPIDNNTVDYVFANMYLHHVESPADAIKEMVRILKPGGMLVITDADEHTYEFLRTEQHDRWLGFKRQDVQSWFSAAGLSGVKTDCVGANCCPTSDNSKEKVSISIFIATGTK